MILNYVLFHASDLRAMHVYLYYNNPKEMDNFLGRYHLPKLNHDEKNNLSKNITSRKIEAVIKCLPPPTTKPKQKHKQDQ